MSDGSGDDSEDGEEDELEDGDEAPTEAAAGVEEADDEAGVEDEPVEEEEFTDKEHESQFCLETNVLGEGEQEDTEDTTEQEDSQGK